MAEQYRHLTLRKAARHSSSICLQPEFLLIRKRSSPPPEEYRAKPDSDTLTALFEVSDPGGKNYFGESISPQAALTQIVRMREDLLKMLPDTPN